MSIRKLSIASQALDDLAASLGPAKTVEAIALALSTDEPVEDEVQAAARSIKRKLKGLEDSPVDRAMFIARLGITSRHLTPDETEQVGEAVEI